MSKIFKGWIIIFASLIATCKSRTCKYYKINEEEIIIASTDTNLFYQYYSDYVYENREKLKDKTRLEIQDDYLKHRMKCYNRLIFHQTLDFDVMNDNTKSAIRHALSRENINYNDSVSLPKKYMLNYKNNVGEILESDTIRYYERSYKDSTVYIRITLSNIIQYSCGQAYIYQEIIIGPSEFRSYVLLFSKEGDNQKWKLTKRIQIGTS